MLAIGMIMIAIGLWSLLRRLQHKLYDATVLQRVAVLIAPSGFLAVLAGWVVTEVGRQPFTVYGVLRTAESVAPIDTPAVAGSLIAFIVVYFTVFGAGVFYLLRLMRTTPTAAAEGPEKGVPTQAAGITPAPALAAGRPPQNYDEPEAST